MIPEDMSPGQSAECDRVIDLVGDTLREHYGAVPDDGQELLLAMLSVLPEFHAVGIHVERVGVGCQFYAFAPVGAIKASWGYDGPDAEFEELLCANLDTRVMTIRINGVPTRVAYPWAVVNRD